MSEAPGLSAVRKKESGWASNPPRSRAGCASSDPGEFPVGTAVLSPQPTTRRAERILARCAAIALQTQTPGAITRTFLSPPMHQVHALLRGWMEAASMRTQVDPVGNLRGTYAASHQPLLGQPPRLVLGSHLDTVPHSGAFDGVLGVVLAITVIEELQGQALPFAIEIIGFSEEEGVRFRKPFLGSRAVVGQLDKATLALVDQAGICVSDAIRNFGLDPAQIADAQLAPGAMAYLEVHIEQGPVLEAAADQRRADGTAGTLDAQAGAGSHLGVVEAIVGQSRLLLTFSGQANHAGTTPMHLRRDPLAAAAEWMVAVESTARATEGLVATTGRIEVEPGISNVIPSVVRASLDIRHADDATRLCAAADLLAAARRAADARHVHFALESVMEQSAVPLHAHLADVLQSAVARAGHTPVRLTSGAGHDAMVLAPHLPSALLFLPSPGGLSHHPDESVEPADVEAAVETVLEFLRLLSEDKTLTLLHSQRHA